MTTARIDEDTERLVIAGTGARPASAALAGSRARVNATITGGGKTWKAAFDLRASRWGGPSLPLPSGEYRLEIDGADLSGIEEQTRLLPGMRITIRGSRVDLAPPIDPVHETPEGRAALEAGYAAQQGGDEDAVFF